MAQPIETNILILIYKQVVYLNEKKMCKKN